MSAGCASAGVVPCAGYIRRRQAAIERRRAGKAGKRIMKTLSAKAGPIKRDWVVLDATGVPVGRLAVEAAKILRGKHNPFFTPHVDTGDHVIIINAERAIYTGTNKPAEPI